MGKALHKLGLWMDDFTIKKGKVKSKCEKN